MGRGGIKSNPSGNMARSLHGRTASWELKFRGFIYQNAPLSITSQRHPISLSVAGPPDGTQSTISKYKPEVSDE